MKTLASLLVLAVAPGLASAQATKDDLIKLAKGGVSEDVILAHVKRSGFEGKPTSDDLVELKAAGIGDKVLAGILAPVQAPATPYSGYAAGTLSVNPSYATYGSYYTPTYVRYYSGSFCRPYYGSYHRSSYCGPRYTMSYSRNHCRGGFSARVRW